MKRRLPRFHRAHRWWQRLQLRIRHWWRDGQTAAQTDDTATVSQTSALDLGVVTGTPMGCMMSDLQRQSAALREAAEHARALAKQVRADAQAGAERLRMQRALEPPAQDALQHLADQVRELRERINLSEERIQLLMADAADQVETASAPPGALVSEGQLSSHPILRHARAANQ